MVEIFTKIAEVAAKAMEKLSEASIETKEKVAGLDKALNVESVENIKLDKPADDILDNLDRPLNENVSEYDENGFRNLTEEEKQELRENTNWPDKSEGIQGCKINEEGVIKYPCRNEGYAGTVNPLTGVEYEKKIVEVYGYKVEVVAPKFDAKFEVQLPEDLWEAKDGAQFKESNKQLFEAILEDPELAKSFSEEQVQQIKDGMTNGSSPEGYTWHHDMEAGKIQLVDSDVHGDTRHTGGRALWGGGNDNRR